MEEVQKEREIGTYTSFGSENIAEVDFIVPLVERCIVEIGVFGSTSGVEEAWWTHDDTLMVYTMRSSRERRLKKVEKSELSMSSGFDIDFKRMSDVRHA